MTLRHLGVAARDLPGEAPPEVLRGHDPHAPARRVPRRGARPGLTSAILKTPNPTTIVNAIRVLRMVLISARYGKGRL